LVDSSESLGSNRAAVLISAFVSLTLTPMLNAYLMKWRTKKSKFYILTEPYFQKLNSNYASSLSSFMKENGLVPILIACFGLIYVFYNLIKRKQLHMTEVH
jgi:HAE1 family hydrophobic/amphiphilic exporter-1/multidrug efflux pump